MLWTSTRCTGGRQRKPLAAVEQLWWRRRKHRSTRGSREHRSHAAVPHSASCSQSNRALTAAPPPARLQVVIFVKSVARARELNRLLNECNFPSTTIHSAMRQEERLQVGGCAALLPLHCCMLQNQRRRQRQGLVTAGSTPDLAGRRICSVVHGCCCSDVLLQRKWALQMRRPARSGVAAPAAFLQQRNE